MIVVTLASYELEMKNGDEIPMLFPIDPEQYWRQMRQILIEELKRVQQQSQSDSNLMKTAGLTEKPLYKIQEVCMLFNITRPTIYEWVKHGKLKRFKIRSRVYFLGKDIQELLHGNGEMK